MSFTKSRRVGSACSVCQAMLAFYLILSPPPDASASPSLSIIITLTPTSGKHSKNIPSPSLPLALEAGLCVDLIEYSLPHHG
ncbi:hypothetical protein BC629DRAFT_629247 [Irpex lacteus]|nr:hypothetical protein BC629DRAFT_629247 [Irpex lacteus]